MQASWRKVEEGVQSDPASEAEEHTSPLATLDSMTQSLMETQNIHVYQSGEVHVHVPDEKRAVALRNDEQPPGHKWTTAASGQ